MAPINIWLSWSSGKDSAWALRELRASPQYQVTALLTTINADAGRVAMHAVREELLDAQATVLGLPLIKVHIPAKCDNVTYEKAMSSAMAKAREAGIYYVAFGDLFLEDIRHYREEKLGAVGMTPIFPIWGLNTRALARDMVAAGLRAHITCVDPKQLDRAFAGRVFESHLLDELPPGVDPCGENGEFHSFAFAGPMFSSPLPVAPGEIVERDGFVFADLLLEDSNSTVQINPGELRDEDLELELSSFAPQPVHKVHAYTFRMVHAATFEELGSIRLRVGSTPHIELYAGHIGYTVHPPHRGHRYATRSVRLLIPLARRLRLDPLWITCDPENFASRRALELAGARLIEIVNVPEDCVIHQSGHPRKCRYRLDLGL